jgi:hypothetical protein
MRGFESRVFAAQASVVASEAFSRSWHFIERDPVLAGHDREALQAELALRIQQIMAADASERDPIRIANGRSVGCGTKRENRSGGLLRLGSPHKQSEEPRGAGRTS